MLQKSNMIHFIRMELSMKLIEALACCSLLLVFAASFCGLLYSYKTVSEKTACLRRELDHDSFIVSGLPRAVSENRVEDFVVLCKSLWADEDMSVSYPECTWTHEGKKKSARFTEEKN